jgi:hypothetical protein
MADPATIPPADSPFATMSPAQALAQINMAIQAAEKSQRYTIGDRELWRGDLRWMYPERARLEQKVAQLARGGVRLRRIVPL